MKEDLQIDRNCPLCASNKHEEVHSFDDNFYPSSYYAKKSWDGDGAANGPRIVRCSNCGMMYTSPSFHYDSFSHIYDASAIASDLSLKDLQHQSSKFTKSIDHIQRFLGENQNTIMDIGTRYGAFVLACQQRGFKSYGIDMGKEEIAIGRSIGMDTIYEAKIEDLPELLKSQGIDRVNCFHMDDVLEHLIYPLENFKTLAQFQRSGDIIAVKQMTLDSLGYKLFGQYWYFIHAQHMNYFSKKTISQFFEKLGYEIAYRFEIPKYKQVRLIPAEWKKLREHKKERELAVAGQINSEAKTWFAAKRPSLLDNEFIIARKK